MTAAEVGATIGSERGALHRVLDLTVTFAASDPSLIAMVDDYLGTGAGTGAEAGADAAQILVFEVGGLGDGSYELVTDERSGHDDVGTLLRRLVTVTNSYAARTSGCVALHAGAVRGPGGEILVIPGSSGAGKSTFTAALVAAGWDYLGDEVIGIDHDGFVLGYPKRISLDPAGRNLLGLGDDPDRNVDPAELRSGVRRMGGRVGPVAHVVFPVLEAGAERAVDHLSVDDGLDALLANTLNLAAVGQAGLATLCDVAETVPMTRLVHGDCVDLARTILSTIR